MLEKLFHLKEHGTDVRTVGNCRYNDIYDNGVYSGSKS